MRKREIIINIRTTKQEKNQFMKNAALCGLSLSEYLRKLANGYTPKPLPPIEYRELIYTLTNIYNELKKRNSPDSEQKLLDVIVQIQRVLFSTERGETDGDNKDMACPR